MKWLLVPREREAKINVAGVAPQSPFHLNTLGQCCCSCSGVKMKTSSRQLACISSCTSWSNGRDGLLPHTSCAQNSRQKRSIHHQNALAALTSRRERSAFSLSDAP